MSLLLTVYNTPDWKVLVTEMQLNVLEQAPTEMPKRPGALALIQDLSQISILLPLLSETNTLWIAVVQAELYLANALEHGNSLIEAAIEWEQITSELLALQRQNRRHIKIVNLHQALTQPDAFCKELADTIPCDTFSPKTIKNSMELLAASQYVTQNSSIKLLNTRLQASAVALSQSELPHLNINQILDEVRQLEKNCKTLGSTEKERDIILFELQKVQEQLEECYFKSQVERQNNNCILLSHDSQHAQKIAELDLELRRTKTKAANTGFAGQLLQQELNQLKQSILWKAAKPVRMLSRLIRKPDPISILSKDIALLLSSEYFDVEWYLHTYQDVAENNMNPAAHYLLYGAAEGRLAGPLFDGNWYLQQYPDVAAVGMNPLMHFILHGQQEGRSSSPPLLVNAGGQ